MLFRECHLNCVDSEAFLANDPTEKACVQNCQEKTYAAFDLMMQVKMRLEARKKTESLIDISRYTEFEVEHGHDTASRIDQKHGVHPEITHLDDFNRKRQSYDSVK